MSDKCCTMCGITENLQTHHWLYEYTGKHPRDELFGGLQLVLDLIEEGELPEIKIEEVGEK